MIDLRLAIKVAIITVPLSLLYCGGNNVLSAGESAVQAMSSSRSKRNWLCKCLQWAVGVSACIALPVCADALLDEPLALSERAPLTQRFNLPAMRSGELLPQGGVEWRGGIDVANNFVREKKGTEGLLLDGESQRYELNVRYGLNSQWEIGAMVPWISYNGGALDNFIEGWHRTFGLPSGDRTKYPTRQLQFLYLRNDGTELNFDRAEAGFGDTQVQLANQVLQTSRDSVALIATLNLPTGDDKKLTGSGGTSAGILLAATHSDWFDLPLALTANLGVQSLPRGDVLGDRQKNSAWFGSGEIAWVVAQDWRLRAQINMHSAIYNSALTALGSTSTELLLGGTVRLSPRWALDAVIGEDIAVETAPDVTLQIALKARY